MPDQMMPLVHVLAQLVQPRPGCRLIFVYDTLMDGPVMLKHCPDAQFISVGRYLSHRFIWNEDGAVSVVRHPQSAIHGLVWEVRESEVSRLDLLLGVPSPVDRHGALIRGPNNELLTAEYYAARNHRRGGVHVGELLRIIDLAVKLEFPTDYVEELMDWFPSPTE